MFTLGTLPSVLYTVYLILISPHRIKMIMPKITHEEIEKKGREGIFQVYRAFKWQSQDRHIGLLDSRAICPAVALRVSTIALVNFVYYGTT